MKRVPERGLTLIEVLVALAIFAVVSVSVLAMFPSIFKLNGQTRADQALTVEAKKFMEGVRTNYSTQTGFDAGTTPTAPSGDGVNGYTCTAEINDQPFADVPAGSLKRVALTCTHPSQPTQSFALDLGRPS